MNAYFHLTQKLGFPTTCAIVVLHMLKIVGKSGLSDAKRAERVT
jgi:hypothetical protein